MTAGNKNPDSSKCHRGFLKFLQSITSSSWIVRGINEQIFNHIIQIHFTQLKAET